MATVFILPKTANAGALFHEWQSTVALYNHADVCGLAIRVSLESPLVTLCSEQVVCPWQHATDDTGVDFFERKVHADGVVSCSVPPQAAPV